jgi:predicted RNA-binding protein with EMAP domain
MVTTKLTTEELESIKSLQTQYNKFVFDLGSIEAQLQQTKTFLESEKVTVLDSIQKLSDKEKELVALLQGKYGAGNIDIQTGEVTPL